MSTFSPNLNIEEVARGGDVGTWDTPTNSNWTLMDSALGGIATIPLNNTNVILSAGQFQSKTLTFNSTLTGSVTITFPTSFTKSYEIQHSCTGSSAFTITLETTATGGQVIAVPPGVTVDVFNDGANLKFKNLWGPIGSYFDWAGSSTPNWNDACTVPPLAHCDGGTIGSSLYPVLVGMIGTTLPDFRGRAPYYLGEGTGRLTSGGAGIDGTTLFAAGGNNGVMLAAAQIPSITAGPGTISVFTAGSTAIYVAANTASFGNLNFTNPGGSGNHVATALGDWTQEFTFSGANSLTYSNPSPSITPLSGPGVVSGIRLIRAG